MKDVQSLLDQETLSCNFCQEDGFLDHEELADHKEEEHPLELHDQNCSEGDVTDEGGLRTCKNCGVLESAV